MIHLDGPADFIARRNLEHEITRLEGLAADLRDLAAGIMPTSEQLARVPVLHGWKLVSRPAPCLTGTGLGYPRLPPGPVLTTDVWAIDTTAERARTLRHLYRVEAPSPFQRDLGITYGG